MDSTAAARYAAAAGPQIFRDFSVFIRHIRSIRVPFHTHFFKNSQTRLTVSSNFLYSNPKV